MNNKKTILYIDIEGGYGGSSKSLYQMVTSIDKNKFEPIVFSKKKGPNYDKLVKANISCQIEKNIASFIPLKKNNIKNIIISLPKLFRTYKLIKRIIDLNPYIIHFNYEGLIPLHYLLCKFGLSSKSIIHFRSSATSPNFLYKIFSRHVNKSVDFLIFISENEKKIASLAGVNLKKIPHRVLYNPVEKISKVPPKKKGDKLRVIYIGTLDYYKGSKRLIELAKCLKKINAKVKINAFGTSPRHKKWFFLSRNIYKELKKQVIDLGLSDWLEYHGYTINPEDEMLKSDMLIHPSHYNDPWGRNIIEALSLGLPVITHGKYNIFVRNNVTGLIFEEWNINKYIDSLERLSNNKNKILKWSKNAISLSSKLFEKKKYGKSINKIYHNL
ncbi:MAG: hypothetical protein CMP24_04060 [Rickettsiales bacterium]|nr:hypothetical protein [Rickettsiales bacterium]